MTQSTASESVSGYDWDGLESQFRKATPLAGVSRDDAQWWRRFHDHVVRRESPRWFYSPQDFREKVERNWPALTKRWIEVAYGQLDDLVHAVFRPVRLPSGDVDWSANPDRTMSWAGFHYWTWANPLVRGYALTRDERFVEDVRGHVRSYFEQVDTFEPQLWEGADLSSHGGVDGWRDWITHNELSAGAKMVTLSDLLMTCRAAACWSVDDTRRVTLLMLRLARRLYETYKDTGRASEFLRSYNFLTSGASGLGAVAAIFPECEWSTGWARLAKHILEVHLMELFYPDGGHRELCTQYHKAGIRDTLYLEQILAANGEGYFASTEPYRSKLRHTLRWLTSILQPDGTTAVLNSSAASNDWLLFAAVANKWLRDEELAWHVKRWLSPEYLPRQKAIPPLGVRFLGGESPEPPEGVAARKPGHGSVLLPDSGVAVLRDGWDRWANAMVLDFGRPIGGHAYPARGCFTLYINGRPAAMSPGSPHAYTDPDYRSWMHTSRSQNNVLIDELDQEQWDAPGLRRVHGEILDWRADADSTTVRGRHNGYVANAGIMHTRTAHLAYGRFFLVHDVLDAAGAEEDHVAKWSIHCPAEPREGAGRKVVADGLMQVVAAWPESVDRIEITRRGKAVWPEDAEDGRHDVHRQLYQARWWTPIVAGRSAEFLMLIASAGRACAITSAQRSGDRLHVEVRMDGVRDVIELPL